MHVVGYAAGGPAGYKERSGAGRQQESKNGGRLRVSTASGRSGSHHVRKAARTGLTKWLWKNVLIWQIVTKPIHGAQNAARPATRKQWSWGLAQNPGGAKGMYWGQDARKHMQHERITAWQGARGL